MTPAPEIVVVDDEPDLRALLEDYLSLQGFSVRTADGAAALDRLLAERPANLILLDVNMPGESGVEALARLRRGGSTTGVILLTAQGGLGDRLTGLQDGADDYVVKPFEPRELLARIRAVLRRVPEVVRPSDAAVRIGRMKLDLNGRRLLGPSGEPVALTAMEYDLLAVFARHPRQVLARDRLVELAHGRPLAPGDRSVDIRIARLRHKLEANPRDPRTLKTVHGEGYLFDPDA